MFIWSVDMRLALLRSPVNLKVTCRDPISNFYLDHSGSTSSYFDVSLLEKYDDVRIIALVFFVQMIFTKKHNCLRAAGMYSSEVTCNRKKPNGVKLATLQIGYLRLLIFLGLVSQNSKFIFLKITYYKFKKFKVIKENGICYQDT